MDRPPPIDRARSAAAEARRLQLWLARQREAFLNQATIWNSLRHRFLMHINRQPPKSDE